MRQAFNYLNPVYHFRRLKEDLALMLHAFREIGAMAIPHDIVELQRLLRGRLFTAFFLCGPFGMVGAALGYAWQRQSQNPWFGWLGTIVFTMILTAIAYQAIWLLTNRALYAEMGLGRKLKSLQVDLWPVHWFGIRTGGAFALLASPINAAIIGALQFFSASLARELPIPVLVLLVDWIVVQGTFMRLMGDFFDRHSTVLADRHFRMVDRAA